jgi:hypothetical protein
MSSAILLGMVQVLQTLVAALQRTLHFVTTTSTGRLIAAGVVVLVVATILRNLVKVFRKPKEISLVDPLRVVDLSTQPLGELSRNTLKVHNLPVRLGAIAIAPLGRIELPSDEELPAVLDTLVPGLGAFVERDTPVVRNWPNQVSVGGFANNLALHLQVAEHDFSESPWCLVAGKTRRPAGLLLVALAFAAPRPNRLGVIRLEDESQWMQAVQVSESASAGG